MIRTYNHLQTTIARLRKRGVIKSKGVVGPGVTVTDDEFRAIKAWEWLREIGIIVSGSKSPVWTDAFLTEIQNHNAPTRFVSVGEGHVIAAGIDDLSEMIHSPCTVICPPDDVWDEFEHIPYPKLEIEQVGWFPVMANGRINPTMTYERRNAKDLGDLEPLAAYVYR